MARNTAIQWCDSTENPTMGCSGCELWNEQRQTCYAGVLHRRFGGVSPGYASKFEDVALFPGRMYRSARWSDLTGTNRTSKPWLNGAPRLIFISDMSDALSKSVSFEYLEQEIIQAVTSREGARHRWLWLTKRPARMAEFSYWLPATWPRNLWVATSITTQHTTSRIKNLLEVGDENTASFLCLEPQIELIDLARWLTKIDWVIQGGESGANARPFHIEWAESLIQQCAEQGVRFFLKQLGSNVWQNGKQATFTHSHGGNWEEWPDTIKVRDIPVIA